MSSGENATVVGPIRTFWPPRDNPTQPCIDIPPSQDDSGGTIRNKCQTQSSQLEQAHEKALSEPAGGPAPAFALGPFAILVTDNQDYQEALGAMVIRIVAREGPGSALRAIIAPTRGAILGTMPIATRLPGT